VAINVPPLRERASDIPLLANYFLKRYANQLNKLVVGFDDSALRLFADYQWPGNVRELQNVIERSVIMTQNRRIAAEDLGGPFVALQVKAELPPGRRRLLDRNEVTNALRETGGNVSKAAEMLTTHRRQLQRLIRRYRIDKTNLS
jgi:DNA-binding NtrC family response regulator